jgi:hypothetical protein
METATLVIALWGAVLSTILAIREITKDRRSLKIILESVHWMEIYRIVITNPAERPITITGIHLAVKPHHGPLDPTIRSSAYWPVEEGYQPPDLPLTLKDGELAIFWLSEFMSNEVNKDRGNRLIINVYDAAGRTYSKYNEGEYDPKSGVRSGKYKPPSIILQLIWKIQKLFRRTKR